ncbi:MAG: eCIS core domain-containing protein [Pseudomonadales bacterium]
MNHERMDITNNTRNRAAPCVLQRQCACGQHSQKNECEACAKKKHGLQRKLVVGASNDPLEQEADRIADQVLTMPLPTSTVGSPRIQRFSSSGDEPSGVAPESVDRALVSQGQPLNKALQQDMGQRFAYDFSNVRVHTGTEAAQSARDINARAYTVKQDVVFSSGQFSPHTYAGRRLLAHELTHVVQQSGGSAVASGAVMRAELAEDSSTASWKETKAAGHNRVQRIVISCSDQRLSLETSSTRYNYALTECSLPVGAYNPSVTVSGKNFHLNFDEHVAEGEQFRFAYKVEAGQENPADFLKEQTSVHVDVVSDLSQEMQVPVPEAEEQADKLYKKPQCSIRLKDRMLVKPEALKRDLFKPKKFKKKIWDHNVPLGQFGWVAVVAKASGGLSANLAASYGPGRLSNICLTHLVDKDADETTIGVGGRAHFNMPARAAIQMLGHGELKVSGEYLSVIEVAAAKGKLNALGQASISGQLDADVEILATAKKVADTSLPANSTSSDSEAPDSVAIDKNSITGLDLAASVGLQGRADLLFKVDLSAGFSIAGVNLWSQSWPLVRYKPGVSWKGGLRYSSNPGLDWDLGAFGVNDDLLDSSNDDGDIDDTGYRSDAAEVEEGDVVQAILDETRTQVASPDGTSPDKALPLDWYKPIGLYPSTMSLPNADDPHQVDRDSGQTDVRFPLSVIPSRDHKYYTADPDEFAHEQVGVIDWPAVGHDFQYMPYDSRTDPEKERFKRLVDALGFSRAGLDIDHVWELNLRGLEYDRFDNLWPASNQEQQLAGSRHRIQVRNYEDRLGNVNGRWFVITRVRHPA